MNRLLLRLIITAIALFAAIALLPGINLVGVVPGQFPALQSLINLLLVAIIFGLINAIVRPILKAFTCAITAATLGLFIFVINALMLLLTANIANRFDLGFTVNGFVDALLGSIIISIVSTVLSIILPDRNEDRGRVRR